MIDHFAVLLLLIFLSLTYFTLAKKLNIIDRPNSRSSHTKITVRGGGIIFPLAALLWWLFSDFQNTYMIVGLLLVAGVSFWDDIQSLSRKFRLSMQFIGLSLGFYQLDLFNQIDWYFLPVFYFIALGIINAINFMDGINGITGLYGLVFFGSLLVVNNYLLIFQEKLIQYQILALFVFLLFNLRKRALMFAGDVGSISLAYLIIYFLSQWYLHVGEWSIILFLLVYGTDVVLTMAKRYRNGERLSEPHRSHFYQILANEFKIEHVYVSMGYAVLQIAINFSFFLYPQSYPSEFTSWGLLFGFGIAYLFLIKAVTKKLSLQPPE